MVQEFLKGLWKGNGDEKTNSIILVQRQPLRFYTTELTKINSRISKKYWDNFAKLDLDQGIRLKNNNRSNLPLTI